MLINTVVLFLRELLPVLLLLSLLLLWQRGQWRQLMAGMLLVSLPGMLLLTSQFSRISQWYDGQGLELLYAMLYLLVAALLAIALLRSQSRWWILGCAIAAVSCLSWVHGANLVLYLWFYQRDSADMQNLWLGAALGLGIGCSVAVLLYYAVKELHHYWKFSLTLMLALLGARQVSMAAALFIQSEWLVPGPVLWDSEWLIAETSEYGHFLNALLGYEATPSVSRLLAFGLTLLLLMLLGRRLEVIPCN